MTYLNYIIPTFFIEQVLTKMQLVNFLCFLNHLFRNNAPDKPSFQDILQSKKHNFWKFAAPAFEVGVNGRRIFWVLLVMRDLNTYM